MSKHTPGPWEWVAEDCGDVFILGTKDKQFFEGHVLIVSKCSSCRGTESHCSLPSKADMELIAAAPQLYTELKKREWMLLPNRYGQRCPECLRLEEDGHLDYCALDAALRKARGESDKTDEGGSDE